MDVRVAVGLIRFGLDWDLESTRVFLAGRGIDLSIAELSLLSDEFLVRWSLFVEHSRSKWAPYLAEDFVLVVDATHVNGGPATVRAVHAGTGVTIHAACIASENEPELVRFLEDVKCIVGTPRRILRDGGTAIKAALERVFPGVAHQLCHFHFLRGAAEALLRVPYEALKKAIVATKRLPRLQEVANALAATPATGLHRALAVFARLAIEHVVSARDSVGGFPFRLAYSEVAQRVRDARTWLAKAVAAAMRLNVHQPLLVQARTHMDALWEDSDVRRESLRVERLASWLLEVRVLMRLERGFNDGMEPPVFTAEDQDKALRRLHEIQKQAIDAGSVEAKAWEGLVDRFREHEGELWAFLGEPGAARTTNQIESCHREDRRCVRKRTGQGATGPAMERVGELLAVWSNARNPWFIKHALHGVDLVQEFLAQEPGRVKEGLACLRAKRWRGRLPVAATQRRGLLEEFVALMEAGAPPAKLQGWADRVEGVAATGV